MSSGVLLDIVEMVGYHGTSRDAANSILHDGFNLSTKKGDWLGKGAYFWQDAPYRAWDWACLYNKEPTVVRSVIKMRREELIDLLDWRQQGSCADLLRKTYKALKSHETLPKQQRSRHIKYHPLDRKVIDYLVDDILMENGVNISAVRAGFIEGTKIFVGSALYDKTHVQIAVRNNSIIEESTLLYAGDFSI